MPTNRQKRTRARAGAIDHWKLAQLVTGQCLIAGVGYAAGIPNGCNFWTDLDREKVRAAMGEDWARHGPDIMAWWRGEHDRYDDREGLKASRDRKGQAEPWAFLEWGA